MTMKRIVTYLFLVVLIPGILMACGAQEPREEQYSGEAQEETVSAPYEVQQTEEEEQKEDMEQEKALVISAGGQKFTAELYENATVEALLKILPMTLEMDELNGNEKYYFLEDSLPAEAESVGTIQTGDIMLYGSECLVVFFQDFSTSYSYTKIGHIEDAQGFAQALERGTVEIGFHLAQ